MALALPEPVVALLAGGQSRRMQGIDKALAIIGGARMIDHMVARLGPQAGTLLIAAPHDYGTGIVAVQDGAEGPAGPVGAIRALACHVARGGGDGFVTAPVDAPLLPRDLVARLWRHGPVAMARAGGALQPACARWSARAVLAALPPGLCAQKWSLHRLGEALGAQVIDFAEAEAFLNVNTPDDLAAARGRFGEGTGAA